MGQDKSEIPRNSSANLIEGHTQGGVDDNPLSGWLLVEAKQKYQQAMQNLNLDSQKI